MSLRGKVQSNKIQFSCCTILLGEIYFPLWQKQMNNLMFFLFCWNCWYCQSGYFLFVAKDLRPPKVFRWRHKYWDQWGCPNTEKRGIFCSFAGFLWHLMTDHASLRCRDGQKIFRVRLLDEIAGGDILTLIGKVMSLALTLPSVQQ